MSPWRPESRTRRSTALTLGLDLHGLAWLKDGDMGNAVARGSHQEGLAQALASAEPVRNVEIIAANDIALHWLQTAPSSVASFGELRLVAGARCALLFGGSPEDWWVTGDWKANQAFACAALPMSVVTPLSQQLEQLRIRLHWHTVWGLISRDLADAFPADGWGAVRSAERVVLWHCRAGQLNCLTAFHVGSAYSGEQTIELARQQMLVQSSRDENAPAGILTWFDLTGRDEFSSLPGICRIELPRPTAKTTAQSEAEMALDLPCLLKRALR